MATVKVKHYTNLIHNTMVFENYLESKSGRNRRIISAIIGLLLPIFIFYKESDTNRSLTDFLSTDWPFIVFFLTFAGILGFVLVAFEVYHNRVILDRNRNFAFNQVKCFITIKSSQKPLEDFKSLVISKVSSSGEGSDQTCYQLQLHGPHSGQGLSLCKYAHHAEVRQAGEQAASFLGLPLEDEETGIILTPEFLGQSAGSPGGWGPLPPNFIFPPQPNKMHALIKKSDELTLIEIPAKGYSLITIIISIIFLAGPCLIMSIKAGRFFLFYDPSEPSSLLFNALLMGVIVFVSLRLLISEYFKIITFARVSTSRGELKLELGSGKKQRTINLRAEGIQEIQTPDHAKPGLKKPGLIIRSGTETLELGSALSLDELRYIQAVIREAMFPPQAEKKTPGKKSKAAVTPGKSRKKQ